MGNTLLKWREPLSVYRARNKIRGSFLVAKWVIMAVLIAIAIRGILRNDYFALFHFIFTGCLAGAFQRIVPTYTIGDLGISYKDGQRRVQLKWSDIEWYLISPEKTAPEVMQVLFSPQGKKWRKTPPAFIFDPKEISEDRLLHILELYLPQKYLRRLTQHS
jgi:hypothetical protein